MEARALTDLVDVALSRSWRHDSTLHSDDHWRCVAATGLALAPWLGDVDRTIVFCFGLLHDTRRRTDSFDPEHGARAVSFAEELREEGVLVLDNGRFERLAARRSSTTRTASSRPTPRSAPAGTRIGSISPASGSVRGASWSRPRPRGVRRRRRPPSSCAPPGRRPGGSWSCP
jgi:hypothetical protein